MKKKQTFEVVKLDRKRGNIVVSRRSIMERIRDNDRDELLAKIKEGDVCGLTPIEAVKMINQNAVVYDLRKPDSYNQKHILGFRSRK